MSKTLDEHYGYLADRVKLDRYRAALGETVRSGDTVVDLGCGTGLLGLLALEAGAGKVVFIEEGPVIEIAERTVAAAGFGDRAEFHRRNSFELELAETADVVVCDHVGYFGFDYGILALLADAKKRFLKPGGALIPMRLELCCAPVETARGREIVSQWRDGTVPQAYAWVAQTAANIQHGVTLEPDNLLAERATIATLELGVEPDPFLSWSASFRAAREGRLDGVAGWFDCALTANVSMTNSPESEEALNRPQAFLPLEQPIQVARNEPINVSVMTRPFDDIIAWVVELPERDERYTLSNFNGRFLNPDMLAQAEPGRLARLNDRGKAWLIVLSHCDGLKTVGEIEALVRKNHPDLFPSEQATTGFIRRVLAWNTSG